MFGNESDLSWIVESRGKPVADNKAIAGFLLHHHRYHLLLSLSGDSPYIRTVTKLTLSPDSPPRVPLHALSEMTRERSRFAAGAKRCRATPRDTRYRPFFHIFHRGPEIRHPIARGIWRSRHFRDASCLEWSAAREKFSREEKLLFTRAECKINYTNIKFYMNEVTNLPREGER